MRHIPDFAIYFTGFISTIFFVFFGVYFSSNKTISIWTLYGGIIFGLLTGFLVWQNDVWKTQASKAPEPQTQHEAKKNASHPSPPLSQPTTKLPPPQEKILLHLFKHKGDPFTFQIAQSVNMSEDTAKDHLEELRENKFVKLEPRGR